MARFVLLAFLATIAQCTILLHPANIKVRHGAKICSRNHTSGFSLECGGVDGPVTFVVNGQPMHKDHSAPYTISGVQLLRAWGVQHGSKLKVTCFGSGPLTQSAIIQLICEDDQMPLKYEPSEEKERLDRRRSLHPTSLPTPSFTPMPSVKQDIAIEASPEMQLYPSPDPEFANEDHTLKGIVLFPLANTSFSSIRLWDGINICPLEFEHGFALVCQGDMVGPVSWFVDAQLVRVEGKAPYSLAGDIGDKLKPYKPPANRNSTFIVCASSKDGATYAAHVNFDCGNSSFTSVH